MISSPVRGDALLDIRVRKDQFEMCPPVPLLGVDICRLNVGKHAERVSAFAAVEPGIAARPGTGSGYGRLFTEGFGGTIRRIVVSYAPCYYTPLRS